MTAIIVIVLVALLLFKLYCAKGMSGTPECYGGSRCGDTDCETCDLYYECERAARERWSECD